MAMEPKARVRLDANVRREEILDATRRLISERGFRGVTLDRVADECKLTRAGLLHYFRSKTDLLAAVLDRQDALDYERDYQDASRWSTAEACREHMGQIVHRNVARREIIQMYSVLASEALSEDHPAHESFRERLAQSRLWLSKFAAGWHSDPDRFAIQCLSFMDGLQQNWLRDPSIDLEEEWRAFADILFAPSTVLGTAGSSMKP